MTETFSPAEPDAPLIAFQSLTNTVHLLGAEEWGDNPGCTGAFTRGQRVTVARREISCKRCQHALTSTSPIEVTEETDG